MLNILQTTTCVTTGTELIKDRIAKMISTLHKGQQITVVFDCSFADERLRVTGTVASMDVLQVKNMAIDFSEICEIIL